MKKGSVRKNSSGRFFLYSNAMKHCLLLFIFCLTTVVFSFGQGIIRGKVTAEDGEALIGARVFVKSNPAMGTQTDFDGNYSLKIADSTSLVIVISYVSYKTIEETVLLKKGQILIKNSVLHSASISIKEVVITGKSTRAKESYMENVKQNSAVTLDYISAQTMKKTGDVNVVAAVARVSGVSTNGGFITVRGIGDRYIRTMINGLRIPTLDPFTNNIKLDMFPSSLVDNIRISKTASPDLPGDWAGAYLSVETKDYPENLSVQVEASAGYNNQTTFKEVLSSQRSSTDWLGYDNGFRDHDHSTFTAANISPTTYQEFVALGLGNYYKSIGVTENTTWNNTYYKLGLVQLGLLSKAQFNDDAALKAADKKYNNAEGTYKVPAFNTINEKAASTGKSFPNNWNTTVRKAPFNFTQSFSIGNQVTLFGKPLGFLFGYRYGNSSLYDPNSTANRTYADGKGTMGYTNQLQQQVAVETNSWSALMHLAYKLNPNNSISVLFMPNFTGVNNVRNSIDISDANAGEANKSQFYEQRKQTIYQFKSDHYLPGSKIKMELNASYTNGKSSAPDFKNVFFGSGTGGTILNVDRYYRYLSDNILDTKSSLEMPLNEMPGLSRKVKIGGGYQKNSKQSDQYDYSLGRGPYANGSVNNGDLDQFFSLDQFGLGTYTSGGRTFPTLNKYYIQLDYPSSHTFGISELSSGFAMVDYALNTRLRFSGGIRVEKAYIFTDASKYDSLHYTANDQRRTGDFLPIVPAKLLETSFLPSANIIYKIRKTEEAPINLRINFSQTVARPSIRELSTTMAYDYQLRAVVFGNPDLKMVQINNYDIRLESYSKKGNNISVSFFYKTFKNHVELILSNQFYSWENVDKSQAIGVELEGKKTVLKHLELRANVTLVNSLTTYIQRTLSIADGIKSYYNPVPISRNMFGQSPYVINGIISYAADSLGMNFTLSYNVQGPRLVLTALNNVPDVYELPRNLVDFKVSKSLGKHFSTSLTIRDILNAPVRRSYKYPDAWIDYDKYTYGTNFVLGISYKL
jgi:TonB-dependent receptor